MNKEMNPRLVTQEFCKLVESNNYYGVAIVCDDFKTSVATRLETGNNKLDQFTNWLLKDHFGHHNMTESEITDLLSSLTTVLRELDEISDTIKNLLKIAELRLGIKIKKDKCDHEHDDDDCQS